MIKLITVLLLAIQLSTLWAQFNINLINVSGKFNCYFYLYTKANPKTPILVDETTLAKSGYDGSKKTIFLVHGFIDGLKITTITEIIEELIKAEDVTPIFVDWNEGSAGPNYYIAANNVVPAGKRIAQFITNAKIDPMKVHCIGHSLGSHVCGNVGKVQKIKRISGLDPAGPLFSNNTISRLSTNDAEFVDVIHTDAGFLGYFDPIGHIDFYPNSGSTQPGCQPSNILTLNYFFQNAGLPGNIVACNHMRVIPLYADTVRSTSSACKFQSTPCDSYANFQQNKCQCGSNGCPVMGYYADKDANKFTGSHYLTSNSAIPYCTK